MDIKGKTDLEEGYNAISKPLFEQLLTSLGEGGSDVLNNLLLKPMNDSTEEILNQRAQLKEGRTIRFRDDLNFLKVYSLLDKFIKENWDDLCNTSLTGSKAIGFINAWQRIRGEVIAISKTLMALKQENTALDLPKVKQFCDFHKLLYELVADILTEFAGFVNERDKINKKIKNRQPGSSEIYDILKKMKGGVYNDLFKIFDPVVRNAVSHPNTKSGPEFNETHIKFKDLHKEAIYTHEDFALAAYLWLFFASSITLITFKRFNESVASIPILTKEEWAEKSPIILAEIGKFVKDNSGTPTKMQ